MPKRFTDYRAGFLEELKDEQIASHYLNAALEDSDEMFLKALRNVAEARQMAKVAEEAHISRESIYRMLTETGNPTFASLFGILKAIGLRPRFMVEPLMEQFVPTGETPSSGIQSAIRFAQGQGQGTENQGQSTQRGLVKNIGDWKAIMLKRKTEEQAQPSRRQPTELYASYAGANK